MFVLIAKRLALISLAAGLCFLGTASAGAATYTEDAVKAAFLHRFGAYVQWPETASESDLFIIAVDGADEVAAQLEELLPGLTIQNRRPQVRRVASVADLEGASVLFIGGGKRAQTRALLKAAAEHPVLVVTDSDAGLSDDAVINFVQVDRTIRFEVSLTAAERRGLKISSGLLSVAVRVEGR